MEGGVKTLLLGRSTKNKTTAGGRGVSGGRGDFITGRKHKKI